MTRAVCAHCRAIVDAELDALRAGEPPALYVSRAGAEVMPAGVAGIFRLSAERSRLLGLLATRAPHLSP